MECINRIMRKFGYYYYSQETQALKLEVDKKIHYLIMNHYTKSAQLTSQEEVNKRQHQNKKDSLLG